MNKYIDIQIKESDENIHELMSKTFTEIHKMLCGIKSTTIGISFPACSETLGDIIRLTGTEYDLEKLSYLQLLSYCIISPILDVPNNVKYMIVSRMRPNKSKSKLRRLIKRGHLSENNINSYRSEMNKSKIQAHYVEVRSLSTGQKYPIIFNFSEYDSPKLGTFNEFGLSKTATVPYF